MTPQTKRKVMNRKLFSSLILVIGTVFTSGMYAQKVNLSQKYYKGTNTSRPKAPSNLFITMYCYPSDGLIAFSFSESIGYIDVTIINEATGETYISEVTHENPSMNVTITHDCPYLVNCITDTGSIFETTISL